MKPLLNFPLLFAKAFLLTDVLFSRSIPLLDKKICCMQILIGPATQREILGSLGEFAVLESLGLNGIHYDFLKHFLSWKENVGKGADYQFGLVSLEIKNWNGKYRVTQSHVNRQILPRFKRKKGEKRDVLVTTNGNIDPSAESLLKENGIIRIVLPCGQITPDNVKEQIQKLATSPEIRKLARLISVLGRYSQYHGSDDVWSTNQELNGKKEKSDLTPVVNLGRGYPKLEYLFIENHAGR